MTSVLTEKISHGGQRNDKSEILHVSFCDLRYLKRDDDWVSDGVWRANKLSWTSGVNKAIKPTHVLQGVGGMGVVSGRG